MIRVIRLLTTLAGRRGGVSALEFAMVAPVLLLLVLGGMDVGRAILDNQHLQDAAASGAAYAVQNPKDNAGIISAVQQELGGTGSGTVTSATMQCRCSDASSIGCANTAICADGTEIKITYLAIRAERNFEPLTPLSSTLLGTLTLTGQVQVRLH
jgi:Flp pilus assembly protein TadG